MPEAEYTFPKGFLWGTATSAYQVEGNSKNHQWHLWEQEPGRIAEGQVNGLACDWWGGRWREDFDRAKEGHHNAIRISVEWSRIQPERDRWDEDALDHYIEMLRGLNDCSIFPMVNFHHFTDPLWLVEMGGWEHEETPALFAEYVEKVTEALKSYVTTWLTSNEPNVPAILGYLTGEFPPGVQDLNRSIDVMTNFARGHVLAYQKIKTLQPEARVGYAHAYRGFTPKNRRNPLHKWSTMLHHQMMNEFFPSMFTHGKARIGTQTIEIPEAKGTQDFFGLNYYTSDEVAFKLSAGPKNFFSETRFPEDAPLSPNGMIASTPHDFYDAIEWSLKWGVPIIITENGTEDAEDSFRREYLAAHLHQLWRAVNFNYPIKGYFVWTLVDNFEWNHGWTRRFGLWELDTETQLRKKRPSADFYAEIVEKNALTSKMVREYAPGVFEDLFPE
ncbi:MAG: glycoside hydrolase family 1 protein [Anaerolineales bacterium]